eukprot:NODE_9747_length_568_cov_2.119101_g9109_i0.p2 GENE.NODE_9747_length_568_cov_2.119101_g9109_i0~~NODE_9747_length_568_cov_2.119101_g9109_i0.p2  ORF type:complete len:111 (-),score=11.24 NODE_9747_length_568_cov_2.119101_g9109_i0:141-473(-)
MYLEFIFSSDDIKRQLPEESKKFAQVDRDFRELTKKANIHRNVLQVCNEPQVLETLRENNTMLDEIQKRYIYSNHIEKNWKKSTLSFWLINNVTDMYRWEKNKLPHPRKI